MPFTDPQGVPASTYRLQLRKEFPFAEASRLVPYLRSLGVSHCYCSPILMSAPGSTHGYDVNDYHRIDTELGGRKGYEEFAAHARAHGMGIILDFVPNHMGIQGTSNRWWQDVLECGPRSPHADFFDVDWRDHYQSGRARVLVPILGNQYGVVLESGRFAIRFDPATGSFALHYEDLRFPLNPATYNALYDLATQILDPVIDYFGGIQLTYGFCSLGLGKHITKRVAPKLDQHASFEVSRAGGLICDRGGAACDFIVEDEDMREVAHWIVTNTPFDRLYFYGSDRPIHVSYSSAPAGQAFRMSETTSGRLVPRPFGA